MSKRSPWNRRSKRGVAALASALLLFGWGWMLMELNLGLSVRNASYDLPFLFQQSTPPEDVVLVHLDEFSYQELGQPLGQAWDRRLHGKLVDRLRSAGARLVVFDILFHESRPEQDSEFADALRRHGKVVLAGEIVRSEVTGGTHESMLLATPDLRRAADGWGLTDIPIDADGTIRSIRHAIPTPFGEKPSLSWRSTDDSPPVSGTRLIDYYGPADTLAAYSYSAAIDPARLPDATFSNKIVLVGARQKAGLADAGKDTFPVPYTRLNQELMPGVEIHGTLIGNLIEGRMLQAASRDGNLGLIALASIFFGLLGCLLVPWRGIPLCLVLALLIAIGGTLLHRAGGIVALWTIPSLAQLPLAVVLSLGAHYLIEVAARSRLRHAFKSYMSDEQARQIDEEEVSLELGGKEVEATILFSDLAGFTSMSEGLPPQSVSKALISYFESATEGILDNQGTIIKYVGDAVMATWGAPLKVDREADRAIDAALQMQRASACPITLETETGVRRQVLETRIGINHGLGLAGNLGSRRRFDYSVIGDTTNLAARLEGMNKMLGTSILVTQAVLDACEAPDRFLTRRMGRFVVKGRRQAVLVLEIYGYRARREDSIRERSSDYLTAYSEGLDAFIKGDFATARAHLNEAAARHDRLPEDPASRLLLDAMDAAERADTDFSEWQGDIVLSNK